MCKRTSLISIFLTFLLSGSLPHLVLAAEAQTGAVPAAVFFPVLPMDAPPDAQPELLPVASNHPLAGDHAGLTRAVIVIHDFSRDSSHVLAELTALAAGDNSTTLIIAPQFLLDSDIARFADHLPDGGKNFARWTLGGWNSGGDSLPLAQAKGISSFTAMDLLLLYLADKTNFPDLNQITLAGHGEGADFVQRYAAAGQAPEIVNQQNLLIRFVVANPSSYLYFTTTRPQSGKPVLGAPPAQGAAPACADFNNWPYGLDAPNAYVKRIGAGAIKLGYVTRPVTYLASASAAHADPAPDTSCGAQMQGSDRAVRAANYQAYLDSTFGDAARKMQGFTIIPNAGYDDVALFGSPCGMSVLFGDGSCAAAPATGMMAR